ncbi:hypothetical protein AmyhaDRAFT_0343 [Haloechinothrix halophila YIM 93223]|uniref:Lipoprotein n=1 Tax=Haloechinothrix halophila YIM 93223 TaxID=592678 RepID=W9DT53_9PSEU|nr:hypothetical protein AmyhaDRAFT_0343 [Haloechinothrix halophila YIM 93223]
MAGYRFALAVLCVAGVVVAGCTGVPDREPQVQRLEDEVSAMPGVEDFRVIYSNSVKTGSKLNVTVRMPTASEAQIAEVATRITVLKQDDFDGYSESTEFEIGDRLMLRFDGQLSSDRVVKRARRLRQLGSAVPKAEINWYGGELELREAPDIAGSLAAVRTEFGSEPVRVEVMPDDGPWWTVDFPFSIAQQQRIRGQLSELRVDVAYVRVANGRPSGLSVGVSDPKTAYRDLNALIATMRPTREHPMSLSWRWDGSAQDDRKFQGMVHVAGCGYSNTAGEKDPERYFTQKAIDLQRRLRDEFDTCP